MDGCRQKRAGVGEGVRRGGCEWAGVDRSTLGKLSDGGASWEWV